MSTSRRKPNAQRGSKKPKTRRGHVPVAALAKVVDFDKVMMRVTLTDGRVLSVPLVWFPRLQDATPDQRKDWRLIGQGIGIHWESIDEDISVESLLAIK